MSGIWPKTYAVLSVLSALKICAKRRARHTCDHEIIQLVSLGIEILFHTRNVCIGDILLAKKLYTSSQYTRW